MNQFAVSRFYGVAQAQALCCLLARADSAAMVEEVQPSRQAVQPHLHGPEPGYPRVLRQEGLMLQMERGEAVSSMLDVYNRYC